ncbi:MAG TPA: hypothetical protein P5234_07530 [Thermoanaerobaculaceae bacterium]|nr:hypothetical protein [Thermoanaerobaculaceae bacterium]HRS16089.1 hypothetical protein [Thermoanaerobaculaceae bacterium]
MKACSEVLALGERFVALELEPDLESKVRDHLAACSTCRAALVATEPALAVSLALAAVPPDEDERFVGEVLSGIRQRRLERQTRGRRRWWLGVAAAAAVAVAGSTATFLRLHGGATSPAVVAESLEPTEPALVEVEGEGVRLYQLTASSPGGGDVQVAFVVDPGLEL